MEGTFPKLSLEQELQLKIVEFSSKRLSREELQSILVDFTRHLMVKENVICHLVKEKPLTESSADA